MDTLDSGTTPQWDLVTCSRDTTLHHNVLTLLTVDSYPWHVIAAPELPSSPFWCALIDLVDPLLLPAQLQANCIILLGPDSRQPLSKHLQTWPTASYLDRNQLTALPLLLARTIANAEQAQVLAQIQQHQDLLSNLSNEGWFYYHCTAQKIFFSPSYFALLGLNMPSTPNRLSWWWERIHPKDIFQLQQIWQAILAQSPTATNDAHPPITHDHHVRHQDGIYRLLRLQMTKVLSTIGQETIIYGVFSDRTYLQAMEARLLQQAENDALTGLPNSSFFKAKLAHIAQYTQTHKNHIYAVIVLDIDRFKKLNDSLGHFEGDQLLIEIAKRLRCSIRSMDIIARLGGDEFAIILDNLKDREEAAKFAQNLLAVFATPVKLGDHDIVVTASIGIALSNEAEATSDKTLNLIRDADTAMYRAKSRGVGSFEFFTSSMHVAAMHAFDMESKMRQALQKNEFRLHYQPIVNLEDQSLVGFEALIRWYSPVHGIISPMQFIPVAEETGLILPLGEWVIRQACTTLGNWQQALPNQQHIFLSVNLSAMQFKQLDLVERIATIIAETHVNPKCLKLELTESLLIDNLDLTKTMLMQLQSMDLRICIDDFGTGYSSLSTLYQLPIHTLKIDKSFVNQIGTTGNGEIVTMIISLAHSLGMNVIAEGIENKVQLEALRQRRCQFGQGFLFSHPITEEVAFSCMSTTPVWLRR